MAKSVCIQKVKFATSWRSNGPPSASLIAEENDLLASLLSVTSLSGITIRELAAKVYWNGSGLTSNLNSINELIRHLSVDSLQHVLDWLWDNLLLGGGGGECAESVGRAGGLADEAEWLGACEERHFAGI